MPTVVADWLTQTRKAYPGRGFVWTRRRHITCADGFTMSVQAGAGLYSTPGDNEGPWTAAEVGFPSKREELLMPYVEDANAPTETVYSYVPTTVIDAVIAKHGGWADATNVAAE